MVNRTINITWTGDIFIKATLPCCFFCCCFCHCSFAWNLHYKWQIEDITLNITELIDMNWNIFYLSPQLQCPLQCGRKVSVSLAAVSPHCTQLWTWQIHRQMFSVSMSLVSNIRDMYSAGSRAYNCLVLYITTTCWCSSHKLLPWVFCRSEPFGLLVQASALPFAQQ